MYNSYADVLESYTIAEESNMLNKIKNAYKLLKPAINKFIEIIKFLIKNLGSIILLLGGIKIIKDNAKHNIDIIKNKRIL